MLARRIMSEYVIAVVPDQGTAIEGLRVLDDLHAAGSVTLYGTVIVRREGNGELAIEQRSDDGPARAGVGSLLGGLVGLFGARDSTFWREHLRTEVRDDFLADIVRELVPGKHAVIAEVSSESNALLDSRLTALGASVFHQVRSDGADDLLEQSVGSSAAELERRRAQRESVAAISTALDAELEHAQQRLQLMAETARKRLSDTKEQLEARLETLASQAAKATAEMRSRIDHRITEVRKELEERQKKLAHAWDEAQQALHH